MAVPDSTAERILQAIRSWLASSSKAGATLTDAQVIPADAKGTRPPLPYLTVKVLVHDLAVGMDEDLDDCADSLTVDTAIDGTTYSFTINGATVAYDRVTGDTNADVAAELANRARADRLTVGAAATGTVYSFVVDGQAVTYTSVTGDTKADVATALADAAAALSGVYASSYDDVVHVAAESGTLRVTEPSDDLTHAASTIWATSDGAVAYVMALTGTVAIAAVSADLTLVADAVPVRNIGAIRTATVSVQGFGRQTAAWLERAVLKLRSSAVLAQMEEAGLSVDPMGGVQDLSALLDTAFEGRFSREFFVGYALRTEPEILVPLATVETITGSEFEATGGAPDGLPVIVSAPTGY